MLHVIALLEIAERNAFTDFETQALAIARQHGGSLIAAFAPEPNGDPESQVDEVHVLQFPARSAYDAYRSDPALQALAPLRAQGIRRTQVLVSSGDKHYEF